MIGMIEKKKQEYTAPTVERFEALVEKGFQNSGDPTALTGYTPVEGQERKFS